MKTKELLLIMLGTLPAGTFCARAQTTVGPVAAPGISITATATAVSQYMFRGQRLGGLSFQPAIEFGSGDGVVGIWSNFPIKDEVPDTSDPEFDLYGSYNFALSDVLSLVPGFTWYVYPDAPTAAGFYRSTFEPNVALNYTIGGVKLTPKLYYDIKLKGPTYELTALYALPLQEFGTELDFIGTVGTYYLREAVNLPSPATKAWGDYWLVGVSMPFQLPNGGRFTLGWAYTEGRDAYAKQGTAPKGINPLALGRGVVSVSYTHSF